MRLRFARSAMAVVALTLGARAGVAQEGGIAVGVEAPAAPVTTLEGKTVDLSTYYNGKPVVLEFWATWCPLCKQMEPAMEAARRRHSDQVNFVSVGVSANQTAERQRDYADKQRLSGAFVFDKDGAAVKAFSVPHTSYIVIIDAKRRVVYTGVGGEQDVEAALKKAGV